MPSFDELYEDFNTILGSEGADAKHNLLAAGRHYSGATVRRVEKWREHPAHRVVGLAHLLSDLNSTSDWRRWDIWDLILRLIRPDPGAKSWLLEIPNPLRGQIAHSIDDCLITDICTGNNLEVLEAVGQLIDLMHLVTRRERIAARAGTPTPGLTDTVELSTVDFLW